MKKNNSLNIILGLLVVMASSSGLFAQATATASATAIIIAPITLTKTVDMNFGNIAVAASTGGTVILSTSGSRTTGGSGGVTLPATTGAVTAASFTVAGASGYSYAITLPSSCTISDGSGHTMTVNSFTSNPSSIGTLTGGSSTLNVGATLNVSAAQTANTYTNSTGVSVTVNYY